MAITIGRVDFSVPEQADVLVGLLDAYALDPMGGGAGLAPEVKACLAERLADVPGAIGLVAWLDGVPAGMATAFTGFSTFAARPLLSIHDLAVLAPFRRQGVGQALLQELAQIAAERECCKLTLEVLGNNQVAQGAYRKSGFAPYALDPEAGTAQFWQKWLP